MACNPFAVFLALQLRAYSMVVVGAAVALIGADRLDRRARSGDPTQRRRRPRPQNLEISRLTCSDAPQSQPSRIRTATFWFLEA